MAYTRVKICGITRAEDAVRAGELGVDAIGLNFVGGPRRIGHSKAIDIVSSSSDQIQIVVLINGSELFREYRSELFDEIFRVGAFQLYGDYVTLPSAAFFAGRDRWAVIPIADRGSLKSLADAVGLWKFTPSANVLDAASAYALGGTGKTFNWNWIAEARDAGELEGLPPIILAGGLTPENVAEAVRIVRPYAVDVSSGVEVAGKPGIKDAIKMRDFIQAARGG